jgi:hypothetical protein
MKQNVKIAKELIKLAKNLVAKSYLQDPINKAKYLHNLLIELKESGLENPLKSNTNLDLVFIQKSVEGIEDYCNISFPLITQIFNPLQNLFNDIDNKVIQQNMVDIQVVGKDVQLWILIINRILDDIEKNYK